VDVAAASYRDADAGSCPVDSGVVEDAGSCPVGSDVAGSCPVGSDAAVDAELYQVDSDVAGSCPVDPDAGAVLYPGVDADVVAELCPVGPDADAALYPGVDADVVAGSCPVDPDADADAALCPGVDADVVAELYPGVVEKWTRLGCEDDGDVPDQDESRGADARPAAGVGGCRDPGESPEVGTREEGPYPGKLVCDYNYSLKLQPELHTRSYCGSHARLGRPVLGLRRPFVGRDGRGAHDAHARVHNQRRSRQVRE